MNRSVFHFDYMERHHFHLYIFDDMALLLLLLTQQIHNHSQRHPPDMASNLGCFLGNRHYLGILDNL